MGWKLRARPPRRFACFSHRWRDAVSSPDSTARFLAFSMVLERFSLRALAASASFSAAVGSFGLPEHKRTEQAAVEGNENGAGSGKFGGRPD